MNINVIIIGFITLVFGFHLSYALETPEPHILPWVPIDVSKSRSFVNKSKDAGMFTEFTRRSTIIRNPTGTVGYKGFDNGSVEWNMLTGICICPPRSTVCPPDAIWTDGTATTEICDIVDAGGANGMYDTLDLGGATGNICDV